MLKYSHKGFRRGLKGRAFYYFTNCALNSDVKVDFLRVPPCLMQCFENLEHKPATVYVFDKEVLAIRNDDGLLKNTDTEISVGLIEVIAPFLLVAIGVALINYSFLLEGGRVGEVIGRYTGYFAAFVASCSFLSKIYSIGRSLMKKNLINALIKDDTR